jgi:hypothetical protein
LMLKDLHPDLFYAIVFGPGFGESIVLRIPPSHWVVVDGLIVDDVSPAAELLSALDVEWSGVVLTHDHEDHAPGLASVLSLNGSGPIGCATPFVLSDRQRRESADGKKLFDEGLSEDTLAKIDQRWTDDPATKWELKSGESRQIGNADLKALWPDTKSLPAYRNGLENRFSTPLLVTWKRLRLLLGADLPAQEWGKVGGMFSGLGDHCMFKVAHHCSSSSISDVYAPLDHPERRTWICTPFSKSRLPRFDDGDGVDRLLKRVTELHLTSLPHPPTDDSACPTETTRSLLRDQALHTNALGPGLTLVRRPKCLRDQVLTHCVIAAGFGEDGSRVDIRYGQGAKIVRQ